jgi:hypothetical protein
MDPKFVQAFQEYNPEENYFSFDWNRQPPTFDEARQIEESMMQGERCDATDRSAWCAWSVRRIDTHPLIFMLSGCHDRRVADCFRGGADFE